MIAKLLLLMYMQIINPEMEEIKQILSMGRQCLGLPNLDPNLIPVIGLRSRNIRRAAKPIIRILILASLAIVETWNLLSFMVLGLAVKSGFRIAFVDDCCRMDRKR